MYETILVPSDGSTGSAHVALHAIELAETHGAQLHALSVVDESQTRVLRRAGVSTAALGTHAEQAVRTIERMAASHGVQCETAIRDGEPAESILDYASEHGIDLIVSGTHGRKGMRRHLIGSVAERIVRQADVPVLTVRLPETDETVTDGEHARSIMADALVNAGIQTETLTVERQLSVWIGTADAESGTVVVYVDPITQRTSVLPQW